MAGICFRTLFPISFGPKGFLRLPLGDEPLDILQVVPWQSSFDLNIILTLAMNWSSSELLLASSRGGSFLSLSLGSYASSRILVACGPSSRGSGAISCSYGPGVFFSLLFQFLWLWLGSFWPGFLGLFS